MASRLARDVLALLALSAGSALAQIEASIDLGAAELRQSGRIASSATVLAGDLRITRERAAFSLGATGAATGGATTGQALLVASVFSSASRSMRGELSGIASTSAATGQWPVTSVQALGRAFLPIGSGGVVAGGSAGQSGWGGEWLPVLTAQVGGWHRRGLDAITASGVYTDTRSEYRVATDYGMSREVYAIRYADAVASWTRDLARGTIAATAGYRAGLRATPTGAGWGGISATWWATPQLGLVGAVGRSPEDVVRGLPESRYAQLSLRWSGRPQFTPRLHAPTARGPRLSVEREAETHRFTLEVETADHIELMGDFTDWAPVSLTREGDRWIASRSLSPGPHRIAIRIDGGPWIVPANLPRTSTEFGLAVGLITVD